MERSEPTLVPEWLKGSNGGVTGTGSSLQHLSSSSQSDDHHSSVSTKIRLPVSNDQGTPRSSGFSDRTSYSHFRRNSTSNGSVLHDKDSFLYSRPYSSFGRSHRDRDRDKDLEYREKERLLLDDHDISDSLTLLTSRIEKDTLRRSQSMRSAKRAEVWPKRVGSDTNNGLHAGGSTGSIGTHIHKSSFERDFPSLGAEEKPAVPEIGRVSSPGLITSQSFPMSSSVVIGGDGWTSALAEVPFLISGNGSSVPQIVPASSATVQLNTTQGLNMAETLAQAPSRARTAPQLSAETQRLEELAIKQSRQLIPMTPSTPKTSGLFGGTPQREEGDFAFYGSKVRQKADSNLLRRRAAYVDVEDVEDYEEEDTFEEMEEVRVRPFVGRGRGSKGSDTTPSGGTGSGTGPSGRAAKAPRTKGPMDAFFTPDPVEVVSKRKMKQTTLNEKYKKEEREKVAQHMARWFYQAGIPFNTTRLDSYKVMVEAIGQFGPGLTPASYHELRVPLLKKEVALMAPHKEAWATYGCSLMADGWTDRRGRTLINFLVNSSAGTYFLESVDASSFVKTAILIKELFEGMLEKVGVQNVVQVVTDNAVNYALAGQLLMDDHPTLFWTPCAAHCIDLMLHDICKLPIITKTVKRAIALNGYIYNHLYVLNMMRTFTEQKELIRPGVTRFATVFLTLQSIHNQKNKLRRMFASEEWSTSRYHRDTKGKDAYETVMSVGFWNNILYSLRATGPLVRVLRLVDSEKNPAMGYIYEAMDRAKEAINKSFNYNEAKYCEIWEIIDKRWNDQLHRPLHAAGYYLNPEYFYTTPRIESNEELNEGFLNTMARLVPDEAIQHRVETELSIYRYARGVMGSPNAIRNRALWSPADWWIRYGISAPHLQQLAVKVLSLTCSSSGCERNWSAFEHALSSSEKSKPKISRTGELSIITKVGQQASSQLVSHTLRGPARSEVLKFPQSTSKLLVLKGRERNGISGTTAIKEAVSPTNANRASPGAVPPSGAVAAPVRTPSSPKPRVQNSSMLDKRPPSQAQNRNDFFNSLRKKVSSSNNNHSPEKSISSSVVTSSLVGKSEEQMPDRSASSVLQGTESAAAQGLHLELAQMENGRSHFCNDDTCQELPIFSSGGVRSLDSDPVVYPDEEEAAFLRSLGWEENAGEEEALTEEEIKAFYEEYMKTRPTAKQCGGLQQFNNMPPLESHVGSLGGVSSGLSSSDSESEV